MGFLPFPKPPKSNNIKNLNQTSKSMTLEALTSPTAAHAPPFHLDDSTAASFDHWVKKQRSKRPSLDLPTTTEDEYQAACLFMLARGGAAPLLPPKALSFKCSVCG